MTDIFDDMFDAAGALSDVDVNTSKDLSKLVQQLKDTEEQLDKLDQQQRHLKFVAHKIKTEHIPALMEEMGQSSGTFNGVEVKLVQKVDARISEGKKEEAFAWLRKNGHDGIIQNTINLSFTKGEDNLAGDAMGILREKGFNPVQKETIHANTLKSFISKGLEQGIPMELDLLGAYVRNEAKIGRKV